MSLFGEPKFVKGPKNLLSSKQQVTRERPSVNSFLNAVHAPGIETEFE